MFHEHARGARHADRDEEESGCGQLPCYGCGDGSEEYGNDVLCAGGVLRRGGCSADEARGSVRVVGGVRGWWRQSGFIIGLSGKWAGLPTDAPD